MPQTHPAVVLIDQSIQRLLAAQNSEPVSDAPVSDTTLQIQFHNHGKQPVKVTSIQGIVDGFKRHDIAFLTAKIAEGKPTDDLTYDVGELLVWCVEELQKKDEDKDQWRIILCNSLTRIVESSVMGQAKVDAKVLFQHFYRQFTAF